MWLERPLARRGDPATAHRKSEAVAESSSHLGYAQTLDPRDQFQRQWEPIQPPTDLRHGVYVVLAECEVGQVRSRPRHALAQACAFAQLALGRKHTPLTVARLASHSSSLGWLAKSRSQTQP